MQVRDRVVELRRVPASELKANPANWRRHPPAQVKALRSILEQVGFAGAALAYETPDGLTLIDGHARQELLDGSDVPVLVLDVDEDEAKLLLATFDPLAAMAGVDEQALYDLLQDVVVPDEDLARALEEMTGQAGPPTIQADPDDIPDLPSEPTSRSGDLWRLGAHRLLCGDSGSPEALDSLGVAAVGAILTDPPYGIDLDTDYSSITGSKNSMLRKQGRKLVDANTYRKVEGDSRPFDAEPLATRFAKVKEQFWFGANYYRRTLSPNDLDGSWLVWDKRPSSWNEDGGAIDDVIGSGFELIWSRSKHQQRVLRHQWSGFTARNQDMERAHPTEKPVALLADVLERWTDPETVVLDPFGGSGTTLIACEQTGRRALLVEIDPAYCDVIVERWENFTGKKAEVEHADAVEVHG